MVLALGGAGFRGGPPWRAWLTGIAAVSLIGSFGEFASPIALARFSPTVAEWIGPHDPPTTNAVRLDGYLRDGDGSPYCLMATFLPGFHTFRFPSKLLSFTVLAVAGLAGLGWDRVLEKRPRRIERLAMVGSGATLAVLRRRSSRSGARSSDGSRPAPADPLRPARRPRRGVRHPDGPGPRRPGPGGERRPDRPGPPTARAGGGPGRGAPGGRPGRGQRPADQDRPAVGPGGDAPGPEDHRRGRARRPVARPLPDPPDADLEPVPMAGGRLARPGPRLRPLGARHDPAQVRAAPRRRVHLYAGRGRALRLLLVLRPVPPDAPGRGRAVPPGRAGGVGGGLPPEGLRPLELALLHPPGGPPSGTTPTGGSRRSCRRPRRSTRPKDILRASRTTRRSRTGSRSRTSRSSGTRTPSPAPGSSTRPDSSRRSPG